MIPIDTRPLTGTKVLLILSEKRQPVLDLNHASKVATEEIDISVELNNIQHQKLDLQETKATVTFVWDAMFCLEHSTLLVVS